jgi:hypothetical protein
MGKPLVALLASLASAVAGAGDVVPSPDPAEHPPPPRPADAPRPDPAHLEELLARARTARL